MISCIRLPKNKALPQNSRHPEKKMHIKIGGIKKKETAKSGCTTHHIQSKTSLPFRIQSWERFKNRGVQKVSDRSQQVLMVDVCLTPRVIILTTQRNPKMITFMGDIQEGYIYSQPFLRIHY